VTARALAAGSREAPLRVLGAARCLPFHGIGGMQAIAWDVLRGLARRGHEVTVLTTAMPSRPAEPFAADGVVVVPLPGTAPGRYGGGWWAASRRHAERHFAGRVDAVLSVSSAAAGLLALKNTVLNAPFVFQAHGSSWTEARAKWHSGRPVDWLKSARNVYWLANDARIYRGFDRLVFVGEALASEFRTPPLSWMTRGIRQTTIANGIDTAIFRFDSAQRAAARARFEFGANDCVVVFAARLHPHKGAAEALRALAILRGRDPAYKLLVVGEGAEAEPLRRLATELGCATAVAFAGPVPRAELAGLLSAGNAFVFPALGHEGFPLNVLEALSVGLPCVCAESLRSRFGELAGVTYADPRVPAALAGAIEATALRGRPPGSLLPAKYSLERCVGAYEAVLRGCVRG
jgi:glycosyltransferase involved in cell wall biosynthesis